MTYDMTWICNAYIIVDLRRFLKHDIMFGMFFLFHFQLLQKCLPSPETQNIRGVGNLV